MTVKWVVPFFQWGGPQFWSDDGQRSEFSGTEMCVKYQITTVFCALYACCHENLTYFAIETGLSGYKQTLKSSSLLCNCLQLFVVSAVMLEVGRMLNLWICPVCDLFLVQCSIESREALVPFLLQSPCRVCCEGNQQWCFCRTWMSSCALPLPASPSL